MAATKISASQSERKSNAGKPLIPPELIDAITEHIADRHSSLTENERLILAVWIIHTYFYVDCAITPYLHIASMDSDAGKTAIGYCLRDLCYLPLMELPTVAALSTFKTSGSHTLIIDEIQDMLSDKRGSGVINDFYRLINIGNRPGATWTVSGEKPGERITRDPFFPKVFIGIGPSILREPLAQRSIRIIVRPGTEPEQTERERRQAIRPVAQTAARLQSRLARLSQSKPISAAIRDGMGSPVTRQLNGNNGALFNRDADIWRVMITIADIIGPEYGKRMREIAADYVGSEPVILPTQADACDRLFKAAMRTRRITVTNWAMPGKAPLLGADNFGMTDADFGFPAPRNGTRDKLPGGTLVLNMSELSAELRFKAGEFSEICAGLSGSPSARDVKRAYQDAKRLHAVSGRTSIRTRFQSGQGDIACVAIDVTHWIWPDKISIPNSHAYGIGD
jgi:hypothetical protein